MYCWHCLITVHLVREHFLGPIKKAFSLNPDLVQSVSRLDQDPIGGDMPAARADCIASST